MVSQILNDMELENQMKGMGDRQLLEFVARETWKLSRMHGVHAKRLESLESVNRKSFGVVGMVGTFIGGVIIAVIEYFRTRG